MQQQQPTPQDLARDLRADLELAEQGAEGFDRLPCGVRESMKGTAEAIKTKLAGLRRAIAAEARVAALTAALEKIANVQTLPPGGLTDYHGTSEVAEWRLWQLVNVARDARAALGKGG